MVLIVKKDGSSSYNKLYDTIRESGFKVWPASFSRHLKQHLVKAGYVTCKPEGIQKTIYTANLKKIGNIKHIKSIWERAEKIRNFYKQDKKEFFSHSENDQFWNVLRLLIFRQLFQLKAQVDFELDKSFENAFVVMYLNSSVWLVPEVWMLQKCVKDEKYRKRVFEEIDKWLNTVTEGKIKTVV